MAKKKSKKKAKAKPKAAKKTAGPPKASGGAELNMLLSDQVMLDSRTGKYSLIGMFQLIRTVRLPAIYPRFTVFAELVGNDKENNFQLEIYSPGGQLLREHQGRVRHYLVYDVHALALKEAGDYVISLKLDGKAACLRTLSVVKVEAKPAGKVN